MQLSGSFLQSVLHLNLSHASHPIGGVLARPLSRPFAKLAPSVTVKQIPTTICNILSEMNNNKQ